MEPPVDIHVHSLLSPYHVPAAPAPAPGLQDRSSNDLRDFRPYHDISSSTSAATSSEDLSLWNESNDRVHMLGPNFYESVLRNVRPPPRSSTTREPNEDNEKVAATVLAGDMNEPLESAPVKKFDHFIADSQRLEGLEKKYKLPRSKGNDESVNQLRYGFFSAYRRIFAVTFTINIAVIIAMICLRLRSQETFTYADAATATGANIAIAVIVRHEHFVNILFRAATALPYSTPICIRRHAARIYSYGGVHSACGVSASLWYIFFIVLLAADFHSAEFLSARVEYYTIASIAATIVAILFAIMAMSHPSFRIKHHDAWELSHRFGGWAATALFWAQTTILIVITARHTGQSVGLTFVLTPLFWLLVVITCCLVYPWLRLRKREVKATQLSNHALKLTFTHKDAHHPGMATRISDAPLKETHGFAVIPSDKIAGDGDGYECIISNAGDWTKKMIENPTSHVWVKGTLGFGALNVVSLFKPVVVVATGSGIAPCLSFLRPHGMHTGYPVRVLWSARYPEETYGPDIVSTVVRADPEAVIINTKKTGTPNMTALAYALYKEGHCEAVMIISNAKVTRDVVYGLESRGVPAFGAIFDS